MGGDAITRASSLATIVLTVLAMIGGLYHISAKLTHIEEQLQRNRELIEDNRSLIEAKTIDRWTATDQALFVANLQLLNPDIIIPAVFTAPAMAMPPEEPFDGRN